jgi:D-alanyl-D-alanine carboxypeptidase/D-alanyl-D-alanine-endopeptidase (penicillin-binding protein 4)
VAPTLSRGRRRTLWEDDVARGRRARGLLVVRVLTAAAVASAGLAASLPAYATTPAATTYPTATLAATSRTATVTPAATALVSYEYAQARMKRLIPLRVKKLPALGTYTQRSGFVADALTWNATWRTRATAPMRGASTTKLATAATALLTVGMDTRWPTRVLTGRKQTEVILKGGGDPLLTSAQLRTLARRTATALVAAAPPAPDPAAAPATTLTTPTVFDIRVKVDDTLYPAPTPASGWPSTYYPSVVQPVRPLIRDLRNSWDSVKDTAQYFSTQLDAELKKALSARTDLAVTATWAGRLAAAPTATEVARFEGNTSGAALRLMLLVSDNDVAEMLYRNNALAAKGSATWSAARKTEFEALASIKVNTTGWSLNDGSGVSRNDRVTAYGLAQLLRRAVSPAYPELAPLKGMLPVGGISGTLKSKYGRYDTSPTSCAKGHVFAKTGTLKDAIGLAGYVDGQDGRTKIFAVLVARPPAYSPLTTRRSVDRIAATATGCY